MSDSVNTNINPHEIIFSLDIGTRNVVGIVGKKEKDQFIIIDAEIMEHPDRAMYDGQIHDIDKVASVAKEVKERLERRIGFPLKYVAIAAAGRALKTCRVQANREIDITKEIDGTIINSLEMEGIQKAQEKLDQEEGGKETRYYCVGYTVIHYYLNDGMITSLKGHRGNKIGADILATFLPHVVVDSLYAVMGKIGLEVINLTLEPIAAIHVAIPPKLRLLNLALIDIGAGTSDIAITQDGTIVAYAMASIAGDEITEAIAKEFLLDFDTAEKLKLSLNTKSTHTFQDVVGIPYTMTTDEIIDRISYAIENLTSEIAQKVLNYNGKAPSAVFCIGGGSQIPTFTQHLAEKLGVKKERVVVRGTDIIENIEFQCKRLEGPEFITPIGIGIVGIKDRERDFIQVYVNENSVKLFRSKQLLVSDALIRAGFHARKLIARRGKSIQITVNGKNKTIHGSPGKPAEIYLNGKLSSLDTPIKDKDHIVVEPAVDGLDPHVTLKDLVKELKTVKFNGLEIKLINQITVNGKETSVEYVLKDGDHITFSEIRCVEDLMKKFNMDFQHYDVYVNNQIVEKDFILEDFQEVKTFQRKQDDKMKQEVAASLTEDHQNTKDDIIQVLVNNEPICMDTKDRTPIFVDVFNYIDFDITKPQGTLQLMLNGKRANYTDPLKDGDRIEIRWEK